MIRYLLILCLLIFGCISKPKTVQVDIDGLVSSNLSTTGEHSEELPETWSDNENERVWNVYNSIVAQGKIAIPLLIENLNRKEFSTYIDSSVPYAPVSVGYMCKMAISEMFGSIGFGYKSRNNTKGETLMGHSYFTVIFDTQLHANQWWKKNQNKSLTEIRILIRDWHIERETQFGFNNVEEKNHILKLIDLSFQQANATKPK